MKLDKRYRELLTRANGRFKEYLFVCFDLFNRRCNGNPIKTVRKATDKELNDKERNIFMVGGWVKGNYEMLEIREKSVKIKVNLDYAHTSIVTLPKFLLQVWDLDYGDLLIKNLNVKIDWKYLNDYQAKAIGIMG